MALNYFGINYDYKTFKTKKLIPALIAGVVTGSLIQTRSIFNGITSIGEYPPKQKTL